MPQNKSYGFYSFPVSVLKYIYTNEILSEVLSNIFNKSIELGTFPSKLKMAKVISIFKSDDETDPIAIDQFHYYPVLTEFLKSLSLKG